MPELGHDKTTILKLTCIKIAQHKLPGTATIAPHIMSKSPHPMLRPGSALRHARLLLVLGVFAVFMHTLAGMGLMGSHAGSDGKFVAGICTALGISNASAIQSPLGDLAGPQPANDKGNVHDCCKLCVASSPLLLASASLAVSPAPTFHAIFAAPLPARPASFAWTAHPPRGPPATA